MPISFTRYNRCQAPQLPKLHSTPVSDSVSGGYPTVKSPLVTQLRLHELEQLGLTNRFDTKRNHHLVDAERRTFARRHGRVANPFKCGILRCAAPESM